MDERSRFSGRLMANWSRPIRQSLQARLLLVTVGGVLFGMLLTTAVFSIGLDRLAEDAADEMASGLSTTSQAYVEDRIEDTAERLNLWMGHAQADLTILADITQTLIDNREAFRPLTEAVTRIPFFKDKMRYYPKGRYSQNAQDEPTVVTVQAFMHDENFQIEPYPQQIMDETAVLDLIMPAIHTYGATKTWTYFVGGEGADFLRMVPWTDFGRESLEIYPEQMDVSYWSYWPGLVEAWEAWLDVPDPVRIGPSNVTAFPPFTDSASGETVQTFGYPLWNSERTQFAGAVWYDLALDEITDLIEEVELAETGFAFLSQADGNVFAIPERGVDVMGLREAVYVDEDLNLHRHLADSAEPSIAALILPQDDAVHSLDLQLSGKEYVLVTRRLAPMNVYSYGSGEISLEHWTIGFVVPRDEVFAPLIASRQSVDQSSKGILIGQVLVLAVTIPMLMGVVFFATRRMTAGLRNLSDGARQIMQGNYDARVEIESEDEIGQLGHTFNEMAGQLKSSFERIEQQNFELSQEVRDRQRAEEALRMEKAFSESVLDAMVDTVFVFDPGTGRAVRWNSAFAEISGTTDGEIAAMKAPDDWYGADDLARAAAADERIFQEGRATIEMSLNTRDGRAIPFEYTASSIRDAEGNPQYTIAIGRDITERRRSEKALKEYAERLEEMVDERTRALHDAQEALVRKEKLAVLGQLAGGVGHELRNPLGVISNAVYFLHMTLVNADETTKEYLHMIAAEVRNAERIVSDLLDFARTRPAERREIAVSAMVARVMERHPAPEGVQVRAQIRADLPAVYVDPRQMELVLGNLVTNAYQAMPGGGDLTITAQAEEGMVALSVADTGCGITQENLESVFEPLFTTKARGIGLGLAVSESLVEANGGSIEVESEVGRGSTFTIRLPSSPGGDWDASGRGIVDEMKE